MKNKLNRVALQNALEASIEGDQEKAEFWYERRLDEPGHEVSMQLYDLTPEQEKESAAKRAYEERMGVTHIEITLTI